MDDPSMGCDLCGRFVADGDGRYINDDQDRVCADCAEANQEENA